MADFSLSYQDYLAARREGDQSGFSESSSSNQPGLISEDEWNALSPQQQWATMASQNGAGGSVIGPDDPRFAAIHAITPGQGYSITYGPPPHAGDSNYYIDPSRIKPIGNGFYASPSDNFTQSALQERHGLGVGDLIGFGIPAAIITLGAAGMLDGLGASGVSGTAEGAVAGGTTAATSDTPLVFAPGMEAQGMAESTLINEGILPGSQEWIDSLAAQGLDTSAGMPEIVHGLGPQDAAESGGTLTTTPDGASAFPNTGNGLQGFDGSVGGLDPETQSGAVGGMDSAVDGITGDPDFVDRLIAGLPSIGEHLPGLVSALKPILGGSSGGSSGGSRGGSGGGSGGGGGVGGSPPRPIGGGRPELEQNPYAKKASKKVAGLMEYLRGTSNG